MNIVELGAPAGSPTWWKPVVVALGATLVIGGILLVGKIFWSSWRPKKLEERWVNEAARLEVN